MTLSIGVLIHTRKAKNYLPRCLPPLLNSPLKPRVVIFNSENIDGTVELAKEMGAEVLTAPRSLMNHGWTRELGRKYLDTDIFVSLSQDVILEDEYTLEKLIKPIMDEKASVSYGRQICNKEANIVSRFARSFNYPDISNIRSLSDVPKYGRYTAFCSDAFCAWLNKDLDAVGGFRWVSSGEDAVAGAMMIKKGFKIAYVAEAEAEHSHNYTPKQEFIRHFDTGLYRTQWKNILDLGGGASDEKRGSSYAVSLLKHVLKNEPNMLPTAFMQLVMSWFGYKFGQFCYHRAPVWLYERVSQADFFWNSDDFKAGRWFEPIY